MKRHNSEEGVIPMKELLILTPIVLLVIGLVGIIAHERGGLTFVLVDVGMLLVYILVFEAILLLACVVITEVL